jgi:hypothetical protein
MDEFIQDELDPEISRVLDEIVAVAGRAAPVRDEESV